MTRPLIIYHDKCNDGFAAAWVANKFFAHEADFHPAMYKSAPPEVHGRTIFILDFSYPREVLVKLAANNKSVFVLDHHKTAAMDLALLPSVPPIAILLESLLGGAPPSYDGLCADFDMGRSGAGLAWDYFFPMIERPSLIKFVEDRDLWLFKDPDTRFIHAALSSYPMDFSVWEDVALQMTKPAGRAALVSEGYTLDRRHLQLCHEIIEQTRRITTIGGFTVPMCNAPFAFASDIGNIMCFGHPFAGTYVTHGGGMTFSLRSSNEGEDVSAVAKKFGGGGHRNAAGFTLEADPEGGVTWPA